MPLDAKEIARLSELTAEELIKRGEQLLRMGRALKEQSALLSTGKVEKELTTLMGSPAPAPSPEPSEGPEDAREKPIEAVGRFGRITGPIALVRAQELSEFTRGEFAEKLGLRAPAVSRFLALLVNEQAIAYAGGKYRCLSAPSMRDFAVKQKEPFDLDTAAAATKLSKQEALEQLQNLADRGIVDAIEDTLFQYHPPESWQAPNTRPRRPPPERDRPSYAEARATGMPVRVSAQKKATRSARSTSGAGGIKGAKQRDKRFKEMQEAKARKAAERRAKAQSNGNGRRAA